MRIEFDDHKNNLLKNQRGVCFDDVIESVLDDKLLGILEHPNKSKYSHQKIMLVAINDYVYAVPYVEDSEKIFLKTVFPSRKYTKLYLKKEVINE
ncbi:toxin [candidate division WWE3 bacterium RIFCSPLOWO2_12_FULL_36_10]|uniref:Toxin n=1 Tax=candidate division WWE3 bacterium RIFCSPLOWO2_12_FULL_36_10 TaxID=1802630 RepID=A0A1F4VHN4_UNCKA|nr:MAG: toxin [candidate division WWE3 bacterium RIFCSPLOWO2_12_FULL_36_10]